MPLFAALTALHIYANYKAVRSLEFNSINTGRMNAILEEYCQSGSILNIPLANQRETLAFKLGGSQIRLGPSIGELKGESELDQLRQSLSAKFFIIPRRSGQQLMVFLNTSADNRDVIAGYITAWLQLRQLPAQNVEGILDA